MHARMCGDASVGDGWRLGILVEAVLGVGSGA